MATKTRSKAPARRTMSTARSRSASRTTTRSSGARGAKPAAAATGVDGLRKRLTAMQKQVNFLLARVPEHERTDLS